MGRIDGGSNYLSQSELSAHFGLGNINVIDELTVQWTNGMTTVLENIDVNQTLTISADQQKCQPGDLNSDDSVDLLDVNPFVDAITSGEFACAGDINGDGTVNLLDVDGFVDLLVGN